MKGSVRLVDESISDNVKRFIGGYIDSVELLEILLLLRGSPGREWDPVSVSRELRSNPNSVTMRLNHLCTRGLLLMKESPSPLYFYKPKTEELDLVVKELAEAYRMRPTRVIEFIFSKQADMLRDFSDAFKFRKDDKNG
ncbi:MAG: hypothetical protein HY282_05195 [Nitrospirae bacterium]|nr:hypothetical protein [Candidatus Manganitrophaceae bacterium]